MVRIHPPRPISEIVNKKTMIITTEKIPIKIWADDMEEGALEQAKNLANLPFAFKHIAICQIHIKDLVSN
jgi:RNA-splicing ligase RtcB